MEEVEVGAAAGGNRPREEFGLSTSSTSLEYHLERTQTGDDKASYRGVAVPELCVAGGGGRRAWREGGLQQPAPLPTRCPAARC